MWVSISYGSPSSGNIALNLLLSGLDREQELGSNGRNLLGENIGENLESTVGT